MTLHLVAKEYGTRPSAILGIKPRRLAYQFDAAVLAASYADVTERAEKEAAPKSAYPSALGPVKRVKINPDGTW